MSSHHEMGAGRVRQKARTRRQILEAGERLRRRSDAFTLDQVAVEAAMSRATVYRYFSSVSALHVELGLAVQIASPGDLFAEKTGDPEVRMLRVHEHLYELLTTNEAEFRAYVKSTMDHWERRRSDDDAPIRSSRRVALIEAALAGLEPRLGPAEYSRLVQAMSLLTFTEPFIVLKDVFHLDNDQADDVMRWAIVRLFRGALASVE